jgi:hypothetical protein
VASHKEAKLEDVEVLDALEAAKRIVDSQFPEAIAAFVPGSASKVHSIKKSDLDILVVLRSGPAPFRETIREFGWPVELFVHTTPSIEYFSHLEALGHRATTQTMLAYGHIILSVGGNAERIQATAIKRLADGPPPLSEEEMRRRRYELTDHLNDFLGTFDPAELIYVLGQLIIATSELALLTRSHWLATGKWLPRHLAVSDPELSMRIRAATDSVLNGGDKHEMEGIVQEVLERVGGPLTVEHLL